MKEVSQATQDSVFRNVEDKLDTAKLYQRAGNLPKAEDLYREILQEDPTHAEAYHLLGLIALQADNYPAAQQLIEAAVELDDSQALYHANLAAAYYVQKEYEKAEAGYRRAVELDPQYDEAFLNLGIVLKHQGKHEEAIEPLDSAVKLRPFDPKGFALLAECLVHMGDERQAEEIVNAATKLGPKDAETLFALANTLEGLSRPQEAITWAQQLVDRDPSNSKYHLRVAELSVEAGFTERGLESARRALNLDPDSPLAWRALSQALMSSTEWDEALETVGRALERFPNHVGFITQKASILERKGRLKEAYKLIRPIIANNRDYPLGTLNVFTSIARKYGAEKEAANMLSDALSKEDLPKGARQGLCFQAGTLFDDVGDYERAFEVYTEGNRLKPRQYHREAAEKQFGQLRTVFTRDFFDKAARSTLGSKRPIFIVGMPRSGTSLTEQILASHPDVYGAGELSQMGTVARFLAENCAPQVGFPMGLNHLDEDLANQAAQMYLDHIAELDSQASWVTDKMPHNFMHLGLIALLFPEAALIHCKRDARDTCLSCYFQNFTAAGLTFAYDLSDLGHHYKLYEGLMRHWKEVLPVEIHDSQYEDLTTDPEPHVRELLDFCGLEWNDRCLEFYKTKRDTKTASYDQVREPMYTKSVARWRRYEKHLTPLFEALDGAELLDPASYLKKA